MTPRTVRVVAGPYIRQIGSLGTVLHHHPTETYLPVRVRENGEARVLWLERGEVGES